MTTQLNTLVRLRQYELDRSQLQLANLIRSECGVAERLEELDDQAARHRSQLSELSRHGQINIDAIRLRHGYLQLLAARRVELIAEYGAAQSATRQQRERLLAADQRLQVAEKLRDRALGESQARTISEN